MRNLFKMLQMNLSIKTQTESQIQKTNFCYQRGKGDQFSTVQSLSHVRLFATP